MKEAQEKTLKRNLGETWQSGVEGYQRTQHKEVQNESHIKSFKDFKI